MKRLFILVPAMIAVAGLASAATDRHAGNATALPPELYMLPGQKADLYTQSYMMRWLPYDFHVRATGDCTFERRIPAVTTVTSPSDGNRLVIDLVDGRDFGLVSSDTITIHVAHVQSRGKGVTAQIIGDSFVQGAFYRDALVDNDFVPGLTLTGLRRMQDGPEAYDEGRGGWTLRDYFTVCKGSMTPYAGFMQPSDQRRYLGDCRFWINVHRVINGELKDFESRYQCGRFEGCACRFDAKTGMPVKAAKNDLMYDSEQECYLCYNGRKWVRCHDEDESSWRFDYGKYLSIWNLEAPEFLFETLGLNDFRNDMDADYSEWDRMLTEMKDSYLKARPDGHFAIVIPCSSCGSMNNRRGDFTLRQNACMWRLRRHIIDTFGGRNDEGFGLVDMGITIDNDNGYRTDSEGLQTGNPHPYPNYPEMGKPLAAYIQYHRK